MLGAVIVNGAKSWFTGAFPEYWLFFLGAAVHRSSTLFLPQASSGLIGSCGVQRMNARDGVRRARTTRASAGVAEARACGRGAVDTTHGAILYLDGITVSFDGFKALTICRSSIETGELRCIIGPNGAGKTTMMDVITGKTRPDAGTAFFGQTIDLTRLTEAEIAHAGIGRKFQKPDGVRAPYGVREPRARDEGRQARAGARLTCALDSRRARPHRRDARR